MKIVVFTPRHETVFRRIAEQFPGLVWAFAATPQAVGAEIADARVLVTSNMHCSPELGRALQAHATGSLGWIHFASAGYEKAAASGLPRHCIITNSTGVKSRVVSEHAVALLLALVKDFATFTEQQREHLWSGEGGTVSTLEDKVVCIVGLGAIAREVARKLAAFDARVIAVSRTSGAAPHVERVFARERLHEALQLADATVIATHADAATHRLIDAAAFAAMKPTAFIVNIARGAIIDEDALARALAGRKIAGAGLDVTGAEPLPSESPLWAMRNVILTPHVAGLGSESFAEQKSLFATNLERLEAGGKLINVVSLEPEA